MKIACSAHKNKTRDEEWAAIFAGALIAGALALARRCMERWGLRQWIELVIEPAGTAGLFIGRVGNESVVRSRQPFVDGVRVLLARGHDPETPYYMRMRDHKCRPSLQLRLDTPPDCVRSTTAPACGSESSSRLRGRSRT